MNVLGLDLSLTASGWATGEHIDVLNRGTIPTRPVDPIGYRLDTIAIVVEGLLDRTPGPVVIEDLAMGLRNAAAGSLGMVHGVVHRALHQRRRRPLLVPPATLKTYATGKGNATKADMRLELYKRTGMDLADDNQCDAVWLWLLGHAFLVGDPLVALPATHTRALAKLTIPKAA